MVSESEIPATCGIGNLVFEKKFQNAIDEGLELLATNPDDPMVHINLMDAYFKGRDLSPDYLEKSTYHARMAILCGHHTGYAEQRLAKNLDKCKKYHQSLQLYSLILDTDGFHFTKHGCGNKDEFKKRRDTVLPKLSKATDSDSDVLFSLEEINQIIQGIRDNDLREKLEHERFQRIMAEMEEALLKGDYKKCDRLRDELHTPIKL